VGGIASQNADWGSPLFLAENAVDLKTDNMAHTDHQSPFFDWWDYKFSTSVSIRSVFVVPRPEFAHRHNWDFTVGDDASPSQNTVCATMDAKGRGGWYTCTVPLMGTHFGLSQQGDETINLNEILAFSESLVSNADISVDVSELYSGSAAENCLKRKTYNSYDRSLKGSTTTVITGSNLKNVMFTLAYPMRLSNIVILLSEKTSQTDLRITIINDSFDVVA
jgi:hypothetical protein